MDIISIFIPLVVVIQIRRYRILIDGACLLRKSDVDKKCLWVKICVNSSEPYYKLRYIRNLNTYEESRRNVASSEGGYYSAMCV